MAGPASTSAWSTRARALSGTDDRRFTQRYRIHTKTVSYQTIEFSVAEVVVVEIVYYHYFYADVISFALNIKAKLL